MESKKTCSFFLEQKNRVCKFETLPNSDYCHHHISSEDYIECPIDKSHTILKSKLNTHIKICPKIKYENGLKQSFWFSQGVNSSIQSENNETNGEAKKEKKSMKILIELKEKDPKFLHYLVQKVDEAFELALKIYSQTTKHIEFEKMPQYFIPPIQNNSSSEVTKTQKDCNQLSSMLKLMENRSLLKKDLVYFEYGAGKGHLSHEIAVYNNEKSAHILLEREPRRNKFDKNHRENKNFIRLRTDINNFNINNTAQILKEFPETQPLKIVGVSKHMCGGATDLSLNSLLNINDKSLIFYGVCLVTCCHHQCTLDTYCNIEFLLKLGFEKKEIPILFIMSSWALTLIYHNSSDTKKQESIKEYDIDPNKKTEIGFKIKRIIDIGRCLYIREKTSKEIILAKYCDLELTPENFAIISNSLT